MGSHMTATLSGADTLIRDVFGLDAFRPGQQEIVEAVTAGENVLAIHADGGRKIPLLSIACADARGGHSGDFPAHCTDAGSGAVLARGRVCRRVP